MSRGWTWNEIPNDITVRIHGQSGGEVGQGGEGRGAVNPRDKIGGRHFFFSSREDPYSFLEVTRRPPSASFLSKVAILGEDDDPFCTSWPSTTIFSRFSLFLSFYLSLSWFRAFFFRLERKARLSNMDSWGWRRNNTVCVTKMYKGNNKYRGAAGMEWYYWRRENWRLGNIEEGRLEGWGVIEKRKLGNIERLRCIFENWDELVGRDDLIFGNVRIGLSRN